MEFTRRTLLQVLGTAGVAAGGGFAANEVLSPRSWLYDPNAVTEANNLFFLIADVSSFIENLPPALRQQVTGGGGGGGLTATPISPTDVDRVALVNGASFVGDTGLPTGMTTVAMSGSFRTAPFRGLANGAPGVESAGEYGGYDTYVAETNASPLQAAGVTAPETGAGGGGDGGNGTAAGQPVSIEETALGIRQPGNEEGALVAGTTVATDDIPAIRAVKQAIDSKQGNVDLLRNANKFTKQYSRLFGDQTVFMGAVLDPTFMTLLLTGTSLILENFAGPGAAAYELFERLVEEVRGAGLGLDVGPDVTTTSILLTYVTRDDARGTGLVQLLDAGLGYVDRNEGFGQGVRDIDADYRGRNIVLRVEMDTEAALSGGATSEAGGGSDAGFGGTS